MLTMDELPINLTEVVRKGGINHEVLQKYRNSGEKKYNHRTEKLNQCVGFTAKKCPTKRSRNE